MDGSDQQSALSSQPDLTDTQKIWLPISKLDAAHQRTVSKMVQAYTSGDHAKGAAAQKTMKLIEQKLSQSYQRALKHIIEKVRS